MKVVIQAGWGGFDLTEAVELRLKAMDVQEKEFYDLKRHDPRLVAAVEEAGDEVEDLKIVEIPDGTKYWIDSCDGWETIIEEGHSWN